MLFAKVNTALPNTNRKHLIFLLICHHLFVAILWDTETSFSCITLGSWFIAVAYMCTGEGMTMKQKIMRPGPSEIVFKGMRFLITDRPTDATITAFIEELKRKKVEEVVRVCEPTYKKDELEKHGIKVLDWQFDDGSPPPSKIVHDWFSLLRTKFKEEENTEGCVAVHCVAGLGRAPVLVAIALMELGMKYEDAVELIRQKRRGAINAKQLSYLQQYKPKSRLRGNGMKQCCIQ